MPNTITSVLDYPAMRKSGKPNRLHRTDCSHPLKEAQWRNATARELGELRECKDCQRREVDGPARR